MELYSHQKRFLEKNPDRYMLNWKMRLGKTLAAILWAKPRAKTLIICPNFLTTQWREECKSYGINADVYSKEQFKIHYKELLGKYKSVIIDEVHNHANPTSQLSKITSLFIKDIKDILLLTGTPYTSTHWCVWQYGIYLGRWKKDSYINFRNKYFNLIYFGPRAIWQGKEDNLSKERLADLIKSFGETLTTEEVFDLPKHITEVIYFEETKEQKKLKKTNEDIHPLSRFTALHQIEAGESDKDEWLIDLCSKEKKIIIVCRYVEQIHRLAKLIPHSLILEGETKDKAGVIKNAEKSSECVLIISATIAEGYGIPSFSTMVYASLDWSFIKYSQMFERNKGPKQLNSTTTYILLIKSGVDERVWECLSDKKDFTAKIMEND